MSKTLLPFKKKRTLVAMLGVAFVAVGTYNSVVVNSDAFMDDQRVRFVKRLDELYGVHTKGREMASQSPWVRLAPIRRPQPATTSPPVAKAPIEEERKEESDSLAAIKEDLRLELVEVFNAKKYPTPPKASDFSGTLTAQNGEIESMTVSLPNDESLSIAFSEMTGNVFPYEMGGQPLSGMIYKMDATSYMVTLTNGPLEGTRLKFAAQKDLADEMGNNAEIAMNGPEAAEAEQIAQPLASQSEETQAPQGFQPVLNDDGSQVQVSQFGESQPEEALPIAQAQDAEHTEGAEGYSFNFEQGEQQQPTTI